MDIYEIGEKYNLLEGWERKRMVEREYKRIKEVLIAISKLKLGQEKKYQLMGKYMWYKLRKILNEKDEYAFQLYNDQFGKKSVVEKIYPAHPDRDKYYTYKKVPILYLKIKRIEPRREKLNRFLTLFLKQKEKISKNELYDPNIFRIVKEYL